MVNDMYDAVLVFFGIKILGGLHSLQLIFPLKIRQATIFRGKKLLGRQEPCFMGIQGRFSKATPKEIKPDWWIINHHCPLIMGLGALFLRGGVALEIPLVIFLYVKHVHGLDPYTLLAH